MQRVHLASDHAGFELKELLARALKDLGHEVIDHGAFSKESCDYPLFAHKLCEAVEQQACPGILVCGTGIGMSIAANRHPGIRAALCNTELQGRLSRRHNNANVLCLGSRVIGVELALAIMAAFLESSFEDGRHQRRLDQLNIPCRG